MPDDLRIPDSVDMQRLSAMQLVAKMKESADKYGVGFIGGFIAPNGEKFMMSNMSDEDTQMLLPDDLKWWLIKTRFNPIFVAMTSHWKSNALDKLSPNQTC